MNGTSYSKDPEMSKVQGALNFDVLRYNDFRMITDICDTYGVQPVCTVSGHSAQTVLPNLNHSAAEQGAGRFALGCFA